MKVDNGTVGALDGQELPGLIEKAKRSGIDVTEVIGDMAYVSEDNLEACGEDITLIARTNTAVAAAAQAELEEGFRFNKDESSTYVAACRSGPLFLLLCMLFSFCILIFCYF